MKKTEKTFLSVVIAAGGSSSRMQGTNKLLALLGGEPVLIRTLRVFEKCDEVNEIVVSASEENLKVYADLISLFGIKKVSKVVIGGKTRLESVFNASVACSKKADYIMVHDGARPLVSESDIHNVYSAMKKFGSAAAGFKMTDTVKKLESGYITGTVDRENLIAVRTPQGADRDLLIGALKNAVDKGINATDECMALEAVSVRPYFVESSADNIKITFDTDLSTANVLFDRRSERCE